MLAWRQRLPPVSNFCGPPGGGIHSSSCGPVFMLLMRHQAVRAVLAALLLPISASCHLGNPGRTQSGRQLTIFVASSLTSAFQDLADSLRTRDSSLVIRLNSASSSALVSQLELGGRADLLATAGQQWMRTAQEKGLAGEAAEFAQSSLVLVVSTRPAVAGYLQSPVNLASPGVTVVLAAPDVPLGYYSRMLLQHLATITGYGPDFPARVERRVVSEELSAAGVVSKLRLSEADAGIIYRAQLVQDSSGSFREMAVPGASNIVAEYLIAPTMHAADSTAAQAFLALLRSPVGREVLQRHGFELPAAQADR